MRRQAAVPSLMVMAAVAAIVAQRPAIPQALRQFVQVDAPVVALTHVRVIGGTGARARDDQTLVIRDGLIAEVGSGVAVPPGAQVIDASGKTVLPGLVMLHE